jgi:hypothetical protein
MTSVANNSNGSRKPRRGLSLPWIVLLILFILPLYALVGIALVRSGILSVRQTAVTEEQFKAIWTLIGALVAVAATLVGALFTRENNLRTLAMQEAIENRKVIAQKEIESQKLIAQKEIESRKLEIETRKVVEQETVDRRLELDTAVKGLELLVVDDHYAPQARIAGGLAILAYLGHPMIALRTLAAAWVEVDISSAMWLIGEVLRFRPEGTTVQISTESQIEASSLLLNHASGLCKDDQHRGEFEWPEAIWGEWPVHLPQDARINVMFAIIEVILSRDQGWWNKKYGWSMTYLDDACHYDAEPMIKDSAAHFIKPLVSLCANVDMRLPWKNAFTTPWEIEKRLQEFNGTGRVTAHTLDLSARLESWCRRGAVGA